MTNPSFIAPTFAALGLAAALLAPAAQAAEAAGANAEAAARPGSAFSFSGAHPALPDDKLAAVRGGFESPSNALQLVVDVQRQVLVNGTAVASAALQFCTAGCAAAGSANLSAPVLVTQNALDQQTLKALTTVNVQANSLQLYRGSVWQSTLTGALTASLRH